jgi:N-acetyltransferase 10
MHWTCKSKYVLLSCPRQGLFLTSVCFAVASSRYAIDDVTTDWSGAEAQIRGGGGNKGHSVVSIMSGAGPGGGQSSMQKRKAFDEGADDGKNGKDGKKTRRSKKLKH